MTVELMGERLRRLRDERGISRSQLSRMTVREGFAGISDSTIEAIEKRPGYLTNLATIEELSKALGVEPESWYEHPLALAKAGGRPPGTPGASERAR